MRKRSKKLVLAGVLTAALAMSSAVPALAAEGWQQNQTGWWYEYNDGSYVTASWKMVNGTWYYFNTDGYMSTGWIQENGKWFFADSTGAMQSGWVAVDNVYYYLNPVSDGTKGMMKTGDVTIDGKIFHFTESGACTNPEPTPGMKRFTKAGVKVERTSGGGSGSTTTNISNEVKEMNEKVVAKVNNTVNAAKESGEIGAGKAVNDVVISENANTDTKTVTVKLNDTLTADDTVESVRDVFEAPVQEMIEDENVTAVTYGGITYDKKDEALARMNAILDDQADRELSSLKSSYEVSVKLVTGETVTYTFSIQK